VHNKIPLRFTLTCLEHTDFITCWDCFKWINAYIYFFFLKWTIFASYDMVHRYVWYNGHGLIIIWAWPYEQKDLLLCLALYPMVICDQGIVYGWGHHDGFAGSVGHPRSNLVRLLVYDSMWQYPGHWYCTMGFLQ
jgi:hypothetical protein